MSVVIWRDSVAAGDDVNAPHEWTIPIADDTGIGLVVDAILRTRYLAPVAGGRATWIVDGVRPLAVLAQQWTEPRWLVPPELPLAEARRPDRRPDVNVRYWCQIDPERVHACLRTGTPLPDRYGR